MLALRLSVPIACWRKAHARELLETESLPPPATCYGALLALVGETDRERHRGVRVTSGRIGVPDRSTVLRTTWRVKSLSTPQGEGENAKPDFQQLLTGNELVFWLDSGEERTTPTLEERVRAAFTEPSSIERFGGWSLGESAHLINDAALVPDGEVPAGCEAFLLAADGAVTLPVWVDHVGTAGTRYVTGALSALETPPTAALLPRIG